MKATAFLAVILFSFYGVQQHQAALPHGMVFGSKPIGVGPVDATKLESWMGKRTRINTAITGKIIKVTKPKGGWFEIDGGHGTIIAAHFKDYGINLPVELKGRTVIVAGTAAKEFIADDMQHLAGDTKQQAVKTSAKDHITFEATGLMVDK